MYLYAHTSTRMKHLVIISLIILTGLSTAHAQDTKFGIKTGANLSMFSASINSEVSLKPGFHLGVYLRHGKTDKFHIRPELYFSSQGQKDNYVTGTGSQSLGKTTTTINAINLPVLFEFGKKVTFQFGPQLGMLLSGHEKGTIQNKSVNDDLKESMNSVDVSMVLGLGFYAGENFNLGVRYNFGVSPIFKTPQNAPSDFPKIDNRVIHLYVAYSF